MVRARDCILSLGGIQAANSYVKINLSLFDLFPREFCPSVPPEMMLLPGNFIYQMSSWTRAIVIPLSIVHAMNPQRPVPAGFDLKELFVPGGTRWSWLKDREFMTWRNVFLSLDRDCEVLGEIRLRHAPQARHSARRAVDAGAHEVLRRAGRDLSVDAVRDHGAGCTGLCAGPSRTESRRSGSSTL